MTALPAVLIVDDRREYLDALTRALRGHFIVVPATSAEEAKGVLQQATASEGLALALIDICLKDLDDPADRSGLGLIEWITSNRPSLPTVAMSALDDTSLPERSVQAGARRFLQKPVRVDDLLSIVAQIAGQ